MKKRIDPVAINSVADFLIYQIDLLKAAKNKLLFDIEKINTVYKGVDANLIVAKYKEKLSKIDIIILNYENFSKYFKNISMSYSNNVQDSKKQLQQIIDTNPKILNSNISNGIFSSEILENTEINTNMV